MSSFNGKNLFASGVHRFHVGGLSLRHVLATTPGGRGVQLAGHGQSGRSIMQTGTLVADDPVALTALAKAVEAMLDGQAYDLVDDTGRTWSDTIMLSFDPQPVTRLGTRRQMPYRIQYLQVMP